MVINDTLKNGVYYLNKNRQLQFSAFAFTEYQVFMKGTFQLLTTSPNEDYIICGVIINGRNVIDLPLTDDYFEISEHIKRQMSPIEIFISMPKTNIYFTVSDTHYRTENEPFEIRYNKAGGFIPIQPNPNDGI